MAGDLVYWPANPFRPDPVQRVTRPFLQTHPRGVPFTLLNRDGKRLWSIIPSDNQSEQLRMALPEAEMRSPPWTVIQTQFSHRGMSTAEIGRLDVRAIMDLLALGRRRDTRTKWQPFFS